MPTRVVEFLAILLMAIGLIPAGAHVFELFGKIGLDRDAYFTVQQIYAGWAYFGIVLIAAVVVNLILAVLLRGERPAFIFAAMGLAAIVANLAIFFAFTFPENVATKNWTVIPENWEALRRQWEYSHAVNAVVMFAGFVSVTLAAFTAER